MARINRQNVVFFIQHTKTHVYDMPKYALHFLFLFTISFLGFISKQKKIPVDKKNEGSIMSDKFKRTKAMKRSSTVPTPYREKMVGANLPVRSGTSLGAAAPKE